jgi:hypothetical protein
VCTAGQGQHGEQSTACDRVHQSGPQVGGIILFKYNLQFRNRRVYSAVRWKIEEVTTVIQYCALCSGYLFLFILEDQSINALMQIVAACCDDRTEDTNTVCDRVQFGNVTVRGSYSYPRL